DLGKFSSDRAANLYTFWISSLFSHWQSVPFLLCQQKEGQVLSHLLDMIALALLLLKINEIVPLRSIRRARRLRMYHQRSLETPRRSSLYLLRAGAWSLCTHPFPGRTRPAATSNMLPC